MAKNFKPGDKVVYKPCDHHVINTLFVSPGEGETVTIKSKCPVYENNWDVIEYPMSKDGRLQSIRECCLHPVQPKTVTLELHKIKLEPKKVLIETEYLTTEQ